MSPTGIEREPAPAWKSKVGDQINLSSKSELGGLPVLRADELREHRGIDLIDHGDHVGWDARSLGRTSDSFGIGGFV